MKFNTKQIFTVLLILLIGLNSISSTSLAIKSLRNRRRTNTKTLSKRNKNKTKTKDDSLDGAKTILHKLDETVKTPTQIAFFAMGIISTWFPKMDDIYNTIKDIKKFFQPCYDFIESSWAMIQGHLKEKAKKAELDKKLAEEENKIDEFETKDEQTSDEKKKQICTETKEKIHKIWLMTVEEHIPDEDIKANYKSQEFFTETYCELPLWNYSPKAHEMIEEEFETKEAFVEICMRLRDIGDCSKYQPDNKGAWYFIKKTFMFVDFLSDGGTCIYNIIKGGGEITDHKANEKVKSLADTVLGTWEITKFLGKEIGAFFAHITSFGIWGFLKAAWHIINLTMNIIKMVKNLKADLPYKIGKLVGIAIKIIKAFVAGRRRK